MGRNKFEDQIRNKLGKREIAPSEGSWDKLSQQLNAEDKRSTPVYWWIGIAATLVAGFFIAGLLYNQPDTLTPKIVDTPVEEIITDDPSEPFEEEGIAAEENKVSDQIEQEPVAPVRKEKETQPVEETEEKTMIAEITPEDGPGAEEDVLAEKEEINISQKLEEIITEIAINKDSGNNPSLDEIDALLYKAAGEISLERKNIHSTGTVDAGDLLFTVEKELEESFRDKVFDMLKEGYLKARTAVANRN